VNEDAAVATRPRHHGVQSAQPAEAVRPLHPANHAVTVTVHDPAFEKSMTFARDENDDLRPLLPCQALRKQVADPAVRKILGFDVNRVLGGTKSGDVKTFNLANALSDSATWHCSSYCHRHIAKIRLEVRRPNIGRCRNRKSLRRRGFPATCSDLSHLFGGFSIYGHLNIMNGPIGAAVGREASLIVRYMLGRVPPVDRQIDPADKGDAVVNQHDLLMMSAVDGIVVVEPQGNTRMILPWRAKQQRNRRSRGMDGRETPDEDSDLELGLLLDQRAQQVPEGERVFFLPLAPQTNARIEIPSEDDDRAPRSAERSFKAHKVVGGIDEHRSPSRGPHPEAIAARLQDTRF